MATETGGRSRSDGSSMSSYDVAARLRALVTEEGLAPGDRIGAERELADRYAVSRCTIRKALEQLERAGIILRTNGRSGGVFVATSKVVRDLDHLVGLPQYLRAQDIEAGTTVLGTKVISADTDLAEAFRLPVDTWVLQIDRLRLAGGLPLCIESVHFPAEMFPGLLDRSLVGSINEVLEADFGLRRSEAIEKLKAVPADRLQASMLQVSVGTPLLEVNRTGERETGEVFEVSHEIYRGDRIEIVVHASGAHLSSRQLR